MNDTKKIRDWQMKALFFGSIGVIAETSEIQRQAYNAAFAEQGLDWYWSVANYCEMLKTPGGAKRVAAFSNGTLSDEEVCAIHAKKEAYYHHALNAGITARAGVKECIDKCKEQGIRLGYITTTTQHNIDSMSAALKGQIDFDDFEIITVKNDVQNEKPDSEIYQYAMQQLSLEPHDVIAIEDTEANQEAALRAQILCYLYAGEYASTYHNLNAVKDLNLIAAQI